MLLAKSRLCSYPYLLCHFIISGGSSSATSVTSGSTAETKPSSAVLCPPGPCHAYSPIESPDSSKRRSFVSLGNNSSNSKSSSNFTGSTKSSQRSQEPGCTSNLGPPLQHTSQPQVYNVQGHYFFPDSYRLSRPYGTFILLT